MCRRREFAQSAQFVATLTMRIRTMMSDRRLGPIVAPNESVTFEEWLGDYVGADGAENGQIAILDLSLVPADVLHVVIAVVARIVFEATQRYRKLNGVELPTVLVLEEAHTFIRRHIGDEGPDVAAAQVCRETFERIAREGRKIWPRPCAVLPASLRTNRPRAMQHLPHAPHRQ